MANPKNDQEADYIHGVMVWWVAVLLQNFSSAGDTRLFRIRRTVFNMKDSYVKSVEERLLILFIFCNFISQFLIRYCIILFIKKERKENKEDFTVRLKIERS